MGGPWAGEPTLVANADGRLERGIIGGATALYCVWQAAPGGDFGDWQGRGGDWETNIAPGAATNADGRLELFTTGAAGAAWHRCQDALWGRIRPRTTTGGTR